MTFQQLEQLPGNYPLQAPPDLADALALGSPAAADARVPASSRSRASTMVCRARLSWRSPERFSRCRVTCPEEAGIGFVPARAAKAASEREPAACDELTSTRAALMRCSSDLAGRSRSLAQRAICRLVATPRNSARSSSGAPTINALGWLVALTLARRRCGGWPAAPQALSGRHDDTVPGDGHGPAPPERRGRRPGHRSWPQCAAVAAWAGQPPPPARRGPGGRRQPGAVAAGTLHRPNSADLAPTPGRVGLDAFLRGASVTVTTHRVGQAAHQASEAVGQVDAGTTADNSSPRQPSWAPEPL